MDKVSNLDEVREDEGKGFVLVVCELKGKELMTATEIMNLDVKEVECAIRELASFVAEVHNISVSEALLDIAMQEEP